MSSEISFVKGNVLGAMLRFSAPVMLGMLVQNLYGAVDLFVVGHFATTADISAVTIGSQLMSMVTQLIIGFATGLTILIGHYRGANDKNGMAKLTGTSIIVFSALGVFLTALYMLLHRVMISLMQTPGEAIKASREYLLVCGVGILFIVGYNVINSILSGMGDATTPFLFVLVACFINVVLDVILVRYARLGALGAAIATTAAQGGSFLFALIYLRIKGIGFTFGREDIRISGREAKKLFSIGAPVAVQNMLVGVSFLFITAIINQMGLIASASVGVVEKLITFMFVPVTAFATAVGAAASQNLGAGQEKRAKKCMWCGIGMALVPAILITVFCQFEAEMLTGILAKSPEVVKMSARYLESYIFDILMVSFVFCMNGYFNSLNKSWFSLLHSLLATFGVRIPLSFVLSRMVTADLYLIGFASPASTLVSLIICVPFLWKLNKKI